VVQRLEAATGLELAVYNGWVTVVGTPKAGGSATAALLLGWVIDHDRDTQLHTGSSPYVFVGRPAGTDAGVYELDVGDLLQLENKVDPRVAQGALVHELWEAHLHALEDGEASGHAHRHRRAIGMENEVLAELGANFSRGREREKRTKSGSVYRANYGDFEVTTTWNAKTKQHGPIRRIEKP